jgi:hypothetical protein
VLVVYFGAYLLLGFVESGLLLGRHLSERGREAGEPAPAEGVLDDEDEVDEQDFL